MSLIAEKALPLKSAGDCKIYKSRFLEFSEINSRIIEDLFRVRNRWEHSHLIRGRWENTYVSISDVPDARLLIDKAIEIAESFSGYKLHARYHLTELEENGFWFNISESGDSTGKHDHSGNAIISSVYYLKVPESAACINFFPTDADELSVTPEEGEILFFPPSLRHSVDENKSDDARISLAFNLYESKRKI